MNHPLENAHIDLVKVEALQKKAALEFIARYTKHGFDTADVLRFTKRNRRLVALRFAQQAMAAAA